MTSGSPSVIILGMKTRTANATTVTGDKGTKTLVVTKLVDRVIFTTPRGFTISVNVYNQGEGYDGLTLEYTKKGLGHWVCGHDEDFDWS